MERDDTDSHFGGNRKRIEPILLNGSDPRPESEVCEDQWALTALLVLAPQTASRVCTHLLPARSAKACDAAGL
jgi:hypothetical protein